MKWVAELTRGDPLPYDASVVELTSPVVLSFFGVFFFSFMISDHP